MSAEIIILFPRSFISKRKPFCVWSKLNEPHFLSERANIVYVANRINDQYEPFIEIHMSHLSASYSVNQFPNGQDQFLDLSRFVPLAATIRGIKVVNGQATHAFVEFIREEEFTQFKNINV